jgi:Raf kinase inhibitor-like YbhB/YbcL family protein
MSKFRLWSPEFTHGGMLAKDNELHLFGGDGRNFSPELHWDGAPDDTKSFALTIYDPDAPTGSGMWHWVIFNIPVDTSSLKASAGDLETALAPESAIQVNNDFGMPGYGGPLPPPGEPAHTYQFRLHALGTDNLGVDSSCSNAVARFLIHSNTIAVAEIDAKYSR